jgi:hypothetical protein
MLFRVPLLRALTDNPSFTLHPRYDAGESPYGEDNGVKVCTPGGCHWVQNPMSSGRDVLSGEIPEEARGMPVSLVAAFR